MIFRVFFTAFLVVFISSCSSHSVSPPPTEEFKNIALNYDLFSVEPEQIDIYDDIFYLTTEQ